MLRRRRLASRLCRPGCVADLGGPGGETDLRAAGPVLARRSARAIPIAAVVAWIARILACGVLRGLAAGATASLLTIAGAAGETVVAPGVLLSAALAVLRTARLLPVLLGAVALLPILLAAALTAP